MRTLTSIAVYAVLTLSVAAPGESQVRHPKEIKTPTLRQLTQPAPKRVQLDNGMVILLMEDHELPLIRGTARIRGGSREVPASKAGMVGILAQSWRTGGTQSRTGDQLDEFLESRAAVVETAASDDSMTVSINVLAQDFDTVFPIFLEVMREPAIRQEKIDLAKTQANAGISRRNDESASILGREAAKLGYGADSPYARHPEYSTISSITRDDLMAFHKRFVHPNNVVLGLVGDFDSARMETKLRQAFNSWQRGPQAPPAPAVGTGAKPGVYFVAKEDINQSTIAMVHGGTARNNPDYAALQVLNDILNNDRLFPRIRTEQGLAYSVGGGVGSNWDRPGLFIAQVGTKSATTVQAIGSLRTELENLHSQPFTPQELTRAKDAILNAHVFTIDSKSKVLNQAMNLEFYGYPSDWYSKYPSLVRQVTADDVTRVAKKYVTPANVALLVVGKDKEFDKPLTTLGTVNPIDITIPEPGAAPAGTSKPAPPAATSADGMALVKKMQDFVGGKARLDAIKSVRYLMAQSSKTPQGAMEMEMDQTVVFPDRIRAMMKMPMGEVTMVTTPDGSFANLPGMGVRDLPASQRDGIRGQVRQDLLTVLKFPERYTFVVTGTEKVGSVNASVLEFTAEGETSRFLVDPASGKLLRKITRSRNPMMQGDVITEYSEWKTFGGVQFPTAATAMNNGEQVGSTTVKSVEINPVLDMKQWERPAA